MVKIPESYANIPKPLKLDPEDKISKIKAIADFFKSKDDIKIRTYFDYFKITLRNHPNYDYSDLDFSIESLIHSLHQHNNDNDIRKFYELLFSNQIIDLFFDKKACAEIFKLEKYQDLKAYLDECLNCLRSGNKLAFLIILRACAEFFLEEKIKKNSEYKNSEEYQIDIFIKEINTKDEYKILRSRINEIKKLFKLYREKGNDVAHCRIDDAKKFIEENCLESCLRLFCLVIENSIFKEDILRINEDLKLKKINSIDFNTQKIDNKINNNTAPQAKQQNEDDKILDLI